MCKQISLPRLSSTPAGRALLSRLAAAVRADLAPAVAAARRLVNICKFI
jgi:hypothetical protein